MGRRGNNEGTIGKRKDGRWQARLMLPDGKRKSYYGDTRAEVAHKLSEGRHTVERGLPLANERQTVSQFLTSWLEMMQHTVKPRTWQRYQEMVRLHLLPPLGRVVIARLTPQQVQSLYAQKLTEGLSPTTVHHLHAMLHKALENALRLGVVPRNVTDLVDPPRILHHEMKVFSPDQARTFLESVADNRLAALYVLALTTGMREGELLGLRWQDVDLEAGMLHVRVQLQHGRDGFILTEPKTAQSRRQIRLTSRAVEALRAHRLRQVEERLRASFWDESYELVFPNTIGRPIDATLLLRRSFWPLLAKAGLPRIRFHDLRHTAATLLLRQGVHPKIVSEMLGHAQVSITLNRYSHVLPDMQDVPVKAMEAALL